MRLFDLSDDRDVVAVRRSIWRDPEDYLELPPVIDGMRGPWFFLHAIDPETNARKKTPILFIEMLDDNCDDWEPHQPAPLNSEGRT